MMSATLVEKCGSRLIAGWLPTVSGSVFPPTSQTAHNTHHQKQSECYAHKRSTSTPKNTQMMPGNCPKHLYCSPLPETWIESERVSLTISRKARRGRCLSELLFYLHACEFYSIRPFSLSHFSATSLGTWCSEST